MLQNLNLPRPVPVAEEPNDYLDLGRRYPGLHQRYGELVGESMAAMGRDFSKLPADRQNLLLWSVAQQETYVGEIGKRGAFRSAFSKTMSYSREGELEGVTEQPVTTADIAAFTTQSIAFVLDLFESYDWLDIVTTRPMMGPTAFIHSRTLTRNDACDAYGTGTALNFGSDASCTVCPEECEPAFRVGAEIDGELLEAECRAVASEYCYPTQWHVSSQYGISLDAMLDEAMVEALQNNIQIEGLEQIRASAGDTLQWSRTIPAGYFQTANPKEWRRVLWERIIAADMSIRADPDSRMGANIIMGDDGFIGVLRSLQEMELDFDTTAPGNGPGSASEFTAFQGVTRSSRFGVYLFTDLPEDMGIVMAKNDADPTFLWAPWIPFTDVGTLVYPKTRKVEKGMTTLYGLRVLRPGRIREIQITA